MESTTPQDDQPRLVYVTCPNIGIAKAIARALVDNREAACVNIVPGVESVYRWQSQVEIDTEHLLMIKTRAGRLAEIDARLAETHPDAVPERIAVTITGGAPAYMDWLLEQTR